MYSMVKDLILRIILQVYEWKNFEYRLTFAKLLPARSSANAKTTTRPLQKY